MLPEPFSTVLSLCGVLNLSKYFVVGWHKGTFHAYQGEQASAIQTKEWQF